VEQLLHRTTIPWLRLLYLYPTGVSPRLLDLMADNERLLPYPDLPMQHVSDAVLRAMNRPYGRAQLHSLLDRIRRKIPRIALRTTFLVGFPGETEADFLELEEFMRAESLDHVGVFAYSNEQGSASAKMKQQIPAREKKRRVKRLLAIQVELSTRRLRSFLGRVEPVLIEGVSNETDLLLQGRTRFQAPEVDGCVFINDGTAQVGDIVPVRISESMVYDLLGGIVTGDEEE
jgi:ribosomal protein S12 methylthiotransferase